MTVNVAIVQARPVYYNLDASLQKSLQLTSEAARAGAQLVAFGETWLPGYPAWLDVCPGAALWDNAGAKAIFAELYANSLTVPGPQTEALARQARESGVVLVMGVNERCGNTLYNSLLTFDADGALRNHHRKLRPTWTERLVWGPGDGAGLRAPQTAAGKVGALVCWEHWMPLPRQDAARRGRADSRGRLAHRARHPPGRQPSLRLRGPLLRAGRRQHPARQRPAAAAGNAT